MRKEIDGRVAEAYERLALPNLPDDAPDGMDVPLLVTFKLGDLRSLKRRVDHIENVTKPALRG